MPTEAGPKADRVRSHGMKLSWDINDPQMPQVCDAQRERTGSAVRPKEGGFQVLAETVDRADTNTHAKKHMRVLKCRWTLQRAELGF